MSSTDGCAIFRWIIGAGLDQKKIRIKKIGKNLSVLLRYNSKLIVPITPKVQTMPLVDNDKFRQMVREVLRGQ